MNDPRPAVSRHPDRKPMDLLDDVLQLVRATGDISARLVAGGEWAVDFEPAIGAKFNAVVGGSCRFEAPWLDHGIVLREGDCCLITRSLAYTLRSIQGVVVPVAASSVFIAGDSPVALGRIGTGDDCELVGGAFTFTGRSRSLLLDDLPPLIVVPSDSVVAPDIHAAMAWIGRESQHTAIGSRAIRTQLAVIMLVSVLRHYAATEAATTGWLAGLRDATVAPALRAIHEAPAEPWTLSALAMVAGVSRSTLAARFTTVIGTSPLDYLIHWRIELACARLRQGSATIASVAHAVGYSSESAFSSAFKRIVGNAPGAYRALHADLHHRGFLSSPGSDAHSDRDSLDDLADVSDVHA